MLDRMAQERQALADLQRGENDGVASSRKPPGRIVAFLSRITGIQAWIDYRRHRDDEARQQDHRRQAQALDARHERERQEIDRRARDLAAIDAREKHSLETALAREDFQRIAGRDDKVLQPEFTRAAAARKDIVKEQGDEGRQPGLSGGARRDTRIEKGTLTALFNRLFRHGADGGRDVTRDSDARLARPAQIAATAMSHWSHPSNSPACPTPATSPGRSATPPTQGGRGNGPAAPPIRRGASARDCRASPGAASAPGRPPPAGPRLAAGSRRRSPRP
jgi:hypothetical protein